MPGTFVQKACRIFSFAKSRKSQVVNLQLTIQCQIYSGYTLLSSRTSYGKTLHNWFVPCLCPRITSETSKNSRELSKIITNCLDGLSTLGKFSRNFEFVRNQPETSWAWFSKVG